MKTDHNNAVNSGASSCLALHMLQDCIYVPEAMFFFLYRPTMQENLTLWEKSCLRIVMKNSDVKNFHVIA